MGLTVLALAACSTSPWPETVEYERLQDLGMHAMAQTLGDHRMVHETVPLYLRNAPVGERAPGETVGPVAWQFEVVRLALGDACAEASRNRCATLGFTLRFDATPTLPLDVSTNPGMVWAVSADRSTAIPEGFLSDGKQPRWVQANDPQGQPLVLRAATFQASGPMTITWRYRSRDAAGTVSPWTSRTTVVDSLGPARAAFCATVRRAPSRMPEVQRTMLVNDGCESPAPDPTVPAIVAR